MRGLLQKDLCLLIQRNKAMAIFVLLGIMMGISSDGSFVVGYLSMLCLLFTIGTISYDEFDNGYPFLFSLPITIQEYVDSKYVFCALGMLVSWCLSIVIYIGCSLGKQLPITAEDFLSASVFLPLGALILSIMLPIHLKYGAERSRIVIAGIGAVVFLVSVALDRFAGEETLAALELMDLHPAAFFALIWVVGFTALWISRKISFHFMKQKEF